MIPASLSVASIVSRAMQAHQSEEFAESKIVSVNPSLRIPHILTGIKQCSPSPKSARSTKYTKELAATVPANNCANRCHIAGVGSSGSVSEGILRILYETRETDKCRTGIRR